jgi:hypothetical protein
LVLGDQNGVIVSSINVSKGVLTGIGSAFIAAEQLTINNLNITYRCSVRQPDLHLILLTGNESHSPDHLLAVEVNVKVQQLDWLGVEKFELEGDVGRKREYHCAFELLFEDSLDCAALDWVNARR